MTFANPGYLFLLLLLVPVVGWYIWKLHRTRATVQLSSTDSLMQQSKSWRVWLIHVPMVLRVAAIALLSLALARPQLSNRWQSESTEGIDIMMALDISGTMLGETAAQTAIIVKSSQNVLLGLAAFVISLMWSYKGEYHEEKPTIGVIWDRFPKFVVGFVLASLVFSFMMDTADGVKNRTSSRKPSGHFACI